MKSKVEVKSLISIIMIIMIIMMNTIVLASTEKYSAKMSLTSSSKLKEGETVVVNVNLTNVNAGAGIDALTAGIEYDTNVFEVLSTSSFKSDTSWVPTFAAATNKMTALKSEKVTSAETMYTINLKVKSSINVDSTTITLKNIVVSGGIIANGGTGDINVGNASVTISKEKDATGSTEEPKDNTVNNDNNGTTNNGNATNGDNNSNANKNSSKVNATKSNTSVKKNTVDNTVTKRSTLPKAGIEQYGMIAIFVIAIVAIFSYILYKKISKEVK